jgi:hypothetical protein
VLVGQVLQLKIDTGKPCLAKQGSDHGAPDLGQV